MTRIILISLATLFSMLNAAELETNKPDKPLEIISITPSSPATIADGGRCVVEFRYNLPSDKSFNIFVRPYTNGKRTPKSKSHGSSIYSKDKSASGKESGYFFFDSNTVVDEVRITMVTKEGSREAASVSQKVKLEWATEPDKEQAGVIKWAKEYSLELKATDKISEYGVTWYQPGRVAMLGVKEPAEGLTLPQFRYDGQEYVAFTFGDSRENTFLGVVDYDTKDASRYFSFDLRLDLDLDGNLAEEPVVDDGIVWLKVPYKDGAAENYGIKVYSIQSNGSRMISYEVLSGRTGMIKSGNFDVGLLVIDGNCNGIFNDSSDIVLIDRDLDGKIDSTAEQRIGLLEELHLPGAIYKIKEIDPAGRNVILELVRLTPETAIKDEKKLLADITESNTITSSKKEKGKFAVGKPSPRIRYKSVDNKPVMIDKMKGKVVLVDFWATWCGPCTAEMPTVISAHEQLHDSGFEIIGISLDKDRDAMVKYINENNMAWPQFYDGKGWDNRIAKLLGIKSIPATVLVDKKGVVRFIDLRGERMIEAAKQLLAE